MAYKCSINRHEPGKRTLGRVTISQIRVGNGQRGVSSLGVVAVVAAGLPLPAQNSKEPVFPESHSGKGLWQSRLASHGAGGKSPHHDKIWNARHFRSRSIRSFQPGPCEL
jgi:hypothetical protein